MKRRAFITLLGGVAAAWPLGARAQQPTPRVPRIGWLVTGSPTSYRFSLAAFRDGLKTLNYIEGQNIAIEYRWAEGKIERLRELAKELVELLLDHVMVPATCWLPHRRVPELGLVTLVWFDVVDHLSRIPLAYRCTAETDRVPLLEGGNHLVPSAIVATLACTATITLVCRHLSKRPAIARRHDTREPHHHSDLVDQWIDAYAGIASV